MKKSDVYKEQLLNAEFSRAELKPYRFFRAETEKTAFIVNLTETECGIGVFYGFCSTAFMPGGEDFFREYGKDKDDCTLRCYIEIESDEQESKAKELIQEFYTFYHNTEKDELLNIVKEQRKAFLQNFTTLLKPLGFKKKGNKWSKQFADEYNLTFEAQKSSYSDQYYFNIIIDKIGSTGQPYCYYTRADTNPECIYNWQLMSEAELEVLLTTTEKMINDILNTNIEALGKQEWVWEHCLCSRKHCDICWVEKNLWEAKDC